MSMNPRNPLDPSYFLDEVARRKEPRRSNQLPEHIATRVAARLASDNRKHVKVDGVVYRDAQEVAKVFGLTVRNVYKRVVSVGFPNWSYVPKK